MIRINPGLRVFVGLLSACSAIPILASADGVPLTAWGKPDFGGIWTTATVTPLERPEQYADRAFLTESENAELRQKKIGGGLIERHRMDEVIARAPWFDPGLDGLPGGPTSMIVEPADGRIPWQADARADSDRQQAHTGVGPFHSYLDMDTGERCISDGVTMFPQHPYNNNFQIFQTPDHIVIKQEMYNEYRIVPLDGRPHIDRAIGQWLGDARGRWQGDTLVIETQGYAAKDHYYWAFPWRAAHSTLRLTERLTRVDEATIDYRFTIEDPSRFAEPWTALVPMTNDYASRGTIGGVLFEFACHEGNYSIPNVLKATQAKIDKAQDSRAN